MIPENKYHRIITPGPIQPTNSDSFFENRIMSKTGFEKFEYIIDRELDHF
jgi:hypothetical protein